MTPERITEMFCEVDDFVKAIEKALKTKFCPGRKSACPIGNKVDHSICSQVDHPICREVDQSICSELTTHFGSYSSPNKTRR